MSRQCPSCGGDCGYTKKHGCRYASQCNIDKKRPVGLVPTPEPVSVSYELGAKLWCVMHKETGQLVNIRITDGNGQVILDSAPEEQTFWIGRDEAQAVAQASFLGDGYVAAFFVCIGER